MNTETVFAWPAAGELERGYRPRGGAPVPPRRPPPGWPWRGRPGPAWLPWRGVAYADDAPPAPAASEYLRWVQDCLNRAEDLRLPADGRDGPDTRAAIRAFQRRQGLVATGSVGPDTERALLRACRAAAPPSRFIAEEVTAMHPPACACPRCRARDGAFELLEFAPAVAAVPGPFSAAEELELAAELLAVTSEAELEQFLGSLVKRAWGGIKKVGTAVGRIAQPFAGVLRTVAKQALPFVGGALGSLIPIPGVGTLVGRAVGSALERESEGVAPEDRDFEMARRFVRIAGSAAQRLARSEPAADPQAAVQAALTAAAREQCPALQVPAAAGGEFEVLAFEHAELGPLTAVLRWLPDNAAPRLFPLADAVRQPGGGLYIAVDGSGRILKVGEAARFATRLNRYRKPAAAVGGVSFYLAHIRSGRLGTTGAGGLNVAIERAVARTLLRAGEAMPWHKEPYLTQPVLGDVRVVNVVPAPLRHLLGRAYAATADSRGQTFAAYAPPGARSRTLALAPATHPQWELP